LASKFLGLVYATLSENGRKRLNVVMEKPAILLLILAALAIAPATHVQAAIECPHGSDFVSSDSSVSPELFPDAISSTQDKAADIGSGSYETSNLYRGCLSAVVLSPENLSGALDPTQPNFPISLESTGQWVAQTVVPEPGKMALAIALGAVVFSLLAGYKGRENIARSCLRAVLCRMPPHRG
jgi:hypothetical protein